MLKGEIRVHTIDKWVVIFTCDRAQARARALERNAGGRPSARRPGGYWRARRGKRRCTGGKLHQARMHAKACRAAGAGRASATATPVSTKLACPINMNRMLSEHFPGKTTRDEQFNKIVFIYRNPYCTTCCHFRNWGSSKCCLIYLWICCEGRVPYMISKPY